MRPRLHMAPVRLSGWRVYDGSTLLGTYPGSRSAAWFRWARETGFVGVYPETMRDEPAEEPEKPAENES